jgi:WD40 repeat protein/GTPase SAR1 family protein
MNPYGFLLAGRCLPNDNEFCESSCSNEVTMGIRDWFRKRKSDDPPKAGSVIPAPESEIPTGLKLRHTLEAHADLVHALAWTPDGRKLISASRDDKLKVWDAVTGRRIHILTGHKNSVHAVAAMPDGRRAVSASDDGTLKVWDLDSGFALRTLRGHSKEVTAVAVAPNGLHVVSASKDQTLKLWNVGTGRALRTLGRHNEWIWGVAFTPDSRFVVSGDWSGVVKVWDLDTCVEILTFQTHRVVSIAVTVDGQRILTGSSDKTTKVWNLHTGREERSLEGSTGEVVAIACSSANPLIATQAFGDSIRLWDCRTWQTVVSLKGDSKGKNLSSFYPLGLAFHPTASVLATIGRDKGEQIRIWDLDFGILLGEKAGADLPGAVQYANAKVVLVGDSGVGKSGLGLVLSGQPFRATESTHGRHVYLFETKQVPLKNRLEETRETLLWDLAGQTGYRLIHQLHLCEVAVALVVTDVRSEVESFAGVRHWVRALRQALRVQGEAGLPMKKFLVAARADRGGVGVSRQRIEKLVQENGFDGYFETSAKEGWQIAELIDAVRNAIDWNVLPRVNSNELFQRIKGFLVAEKEAGQLLTTAEDLYRALLHQAGDLADTPLLRAQFDTCIGRIEARDLIRRLKFGNLVLLQPEMLDAYASALVNTAKDEPAGLGCLTERKAQAGEFRMSKDERVLDAGQEKLLLIATIEDLFRHEIALREQGEDGPYLVFPSQFTRDWEEAPDPPGKAVVFTFEGPILNIYATLAVRLSHSGMFARDDMWRNAAAFVARAGGRCGIYLREFGEGRGELTLFFDERVSVETRIHFEEFVHSHVRSRALAEPFERRPIVKCPVCREPVPDRLVQVRRDKGFDWVTCPACEERISLAGETESATVVALPSPALLEMDRTANVRRDRSAAALVLAGKVATGDFDVFLCHHSMDKPEVKIIGEQLKEREILPWLDEWELRPGLPWQKVLEDQIKKIKTAAVFVGRHAPGPWQDMESAGFLRQFVKRQCPVIPVILPNCEATPELPPFLEGMTWVDFRDPDSKPLERLIWGITGKRNLG